MGYNSKVFVRIHNLFPTTAKQITLKHKYGNDHPVSITSKNIKGEGVTDYLEAGFNTGLFTSSDYWQLELEFEDGIIWKTDGWVECTLHSGDNGKHLTFGASVGKLNLNTSSPKSLRLSASNGYNSMAAIYFENKFPVTVGLKVSHYYSNDSNKQQKKEWHAIKPGGKTSTPLHVYFTTGGVSMGSDYWNAEVTLDTLPPAGYEANGFPKLVNETKDKGFMLTSKDVGKALTFVIQADGLHLSTTIDQWKTPNGYNSLALISLKNNSSIMIQKFTLSHHYSTDKVFHFTGGELAANGGTSNKMMVEYNTGLKEMSTDHWGLLIVDENNFVYKNSKKNKECLLRIQDSLKTLEFGVTLDEFSINLPSGSCYDGMQKDLTKDSNLGIDSTKPYHQNAYLAAHNAFSSLGYGYIYVQQSLTLRDQLAAGVRTFLLDIYSYTPTLQETDIYLFHGESVARVLTNAPFYFAPFKLSDALKEIAAFIKTSKSVVTIIFEDHVDPADRSKIMTAFETAGLADNLFTKTDAFKTVEQKGWPTLNWMIDNKKNLIVLSSDKTENLFPYQWKYMSENVYSNPSTDPKTWLEPRSESKPLDQKKLCAINNFRTISTINAFNLKEWVGITAGTNTYNHLKSHIDACASTWKRYPNYLNLDFVTIPDNQPAKAITYLNQKLHGVAVTATPSDIKQNGNCPPNSRPGIGTKNRTFHSYSFFDSKGTNRFPANTKAVSALPATAISPTLKSPNPFGLAFRPAKTPTNFSKPLGRVVGRNTLFLRQMNPVQKILRTTVHNANRFIRRFSK